MKLKSKKIGFTMMLSVFSIVLSVGINFTLTPYITNEVGPEAYGFVSLAKQFISYANIFMIVLNSYAARYLTIAYVSKNTKEFKRYYSTVFIADVIVGGVFLIVGCFCVLNLERILNISPELVSDVKLLFLLTFFSFFLTTITTVFNASAFVKDHLDYANVIKVVAYIMEAIILLFCFVMFDASVWYVGVAAIVMAFFTLTASYMMTRSLLPQIHIKCCDFSLSAIKKLIGKGFWNSINSLGNGLNSGLDILITNLMLNGIAMGKISIAKTLANVVFQFYDAMSQPFQPSFLRKYAEKDITKLLDYLKRAMTICGLFTNVLFAGFCAVGYDFLSLWIPTQDNLLIYRLVIIALLPAITEGCIYPAYYVYTLTLKNKFPCVITIVGGIANVIGMYVLLKFSDIGIYAIPITTAVVMSFINLVTNPLYMCHCLKVKWSTFYPTIFKNIICCLLAVICTQFVVSYLNLALSWFNLFLKILVLVLLGVIIQIPFSFSGIILKRIRRD